MSPPNVILLCTLAVTIAVAAAEASIPSLANNPRPMDLVVAVIFSLCAFAWVRADARARQIEPPLGSALLAALIIPIGVPVYLLRALGWRRGSWLSLKALLFLVLVAATYVGVSYVFALFGLPYETL